MRATYDRLNQCRHGLVMITAATIIAAVLLAASAIGVQRGSFEMTGTLIKMLNLSTPALVPTGHALRDAAYTHPAIDLRHSPHLPTVDLPPLEIFYGSPAANRRDSQRK